MKPAIAISVCLLPFVLLLNSCALPPPKSPANSVVKVSLSTGAPEGLASGQTPSPKLEATYASIRDQIFTPSCTRCHNPGGEARNVILDDYRRLFNSPRDLLIAGDAENSGLILALTRTDDQQMPPQESGQRPLSLDDIMTIKKWIEEGALNN